MKKIVKIWNFLKWNILDIVVYFSLLPFFWDFSRSVIVCISFTIAFIFMVKIQNISIEKRIDTLVNEGNIKIK